MDSLTARPLSGPLPAGTLLAAVMMGGDVTLRGAGERRAGRVCERPGGTAGVGLVLVRLLPRPRARPGGC